MFKNDFYPINNALIHYQNTLLLRYLKENKSVQYVVVVNTDVDVLININNEYIINCTGFNVLHGFIVVSYLTYTIISSCFLYSYCTMYTYYVPGTYVDGGNL